MAVTRSSVKKKDPTRTDANGQPIFTLDSATNEPAEVPTITKLLNRRKLKGAQKTSAAGAPASPADRPADARPQIQKVVKRAISSAQRRLIIWTRPELAQSEDQVCRALHLLCETQNVQQAVLLNLFEQSTYRVTHGLEAGEKAALWTGLSFHPSASPEVWQLLSTQGVVEAPGENELPPARQTTAESSALRFIRNLFGVQPEERLVIFRQGTGSRCQGILAVVSEHPLGPAVPKAVQILRESPSRKKASA